MFETNDQEIRGEISISPPLVIEWKVDYFSLSKGMDRRFRSPTFQYLDGTWFLRCYPNGQVQDWISIYLRKEKSDSSRHHIVYQIGIRDVNGIVYHSNCDEKVFGGDVESTGWKTFLQKSSLLKDKWLIAPRGVVTFFCILRTKANRDMASETVRFTDRSVSTETLKKDLKEAEIISGCVEEALLFSTGTDKLAEDLKSLMLKEENCDVTIKINEREFKAHRLILGARSPVFASMFSHDTIERNTGIVSIEDCDPDIFQTFLIFLYSGEIQEFTSDNVCHLYVVAEKYDVQELKWKCIKHLANYLSVDNFCEVMSLALRYKECRLVKLVSDFFVKNAKRIIVTTQWQCFLNEYPSECNELYIKTLEHLIPE